MLSIPTDSLLLASGPSGEAFWSSASFALHWLLALGITVRAMRQRRPIGASLAWITLALALPLALPFVGAALYFLVGERRQDSKRRPRIAQGCERLAARLASLGERADEHRPLDPSASRLIQGALGLPIVSTHRLELLSGYEATFAALIEAVEGRRPPVAWSSTSGTLVA